MAECQTSQQKRISGVQEEFAKESINSRKDNDMFRYRKSRNLKYNEQGLIYFLCHNYHKMPQNVQEMIKNRCKNTCGHHWNAVFDYMTTDKSFISVCMKHYISESTLADNILRFYKDWDLKL